METYNLNCKETFFELSKEEQEKIKIFLGNCRQEDQVAIRLQDDQGNQPYLYGCYSLTPDEYYNYHQSGGNWSHVSAIIAQDMFLGQIVENNKKIKINKELSLLINKDKVSFWRKDEFHQLPIKAIGIKKISKGSLWESSMYRLPVDIEKRIKKL